MKANQLRSDDDRHAPAQHGAAPAPPATPFRGIRDTVDHDVAACSGACEYHRTIIAMLAALDAHAEVTGCVRAFYVPDNRADCICASCNAVLHHGPEFAPDA